jgi:hypothetical protein
MICFHYFPSAWFNVIVRISIYWVKIHTYVRIYETPALLDLTIDGPGNMWKSRVPDRLVQVRVEKVPATARSTYSTPYCRDSWVCVPGLGWFSKNPLPQ